MAKNSINLSDYEDIEVYNMVRFGIIGRFPNNFWVDQILIKLQKI